MNASSLAASICIFYLLRTSISFICFLNACINSFLCLSNLLFSSSSLSMSFLNASFLVASPALASLSCYLYFSNSSIALLSLASLVPPSCWVFLLSLSSASSSLFYSDKLFSNAVSLVWRSWFYCFSFCIYVFDELILSLNFFASSVSLLFWASSSSW